MEIEELATVAVDCGFKLHRRLGPGLLESVYEAVLAESLVRRGVAIERQKPVPILFDGIAINEGCRVPLHDPPSRSEPGAPVVPFPVGRAHTTRTRGSARALVSSLTPHTIASARSGEWPGPW